jgi:hypothetical protein
MEISAAGAKLLTPHVLLELTLSRCASMPKLGYDAAILREVDIFSSVNESLKQQTEDS